MLFRSGGFFGAGHKESEEGREGDFDAVDEAEACGAAQLEEGETGRGGGDEEAACIGAISEVPARVRGRRRTVVPQRNLGIWPDSRFREELLHDNVVLLHLPRLNDRLVPKHKDRFSADGRDELPYLSHDVDFDDPRRFLRGRDLERDVEDGKVDAEESATRAAGEEGEVE